MCCYSVFFKSSASQFEAHLASRRWLLPHERTCKSTVCHFFLRLSIKSVLAHRINGAIQTPWSGPNNLIRPKLARQGWYKINGNVSFRRTAEGFCLSASDALVPYKQGHEKEGERHISYSLCSSIGISEAILMLFDLCSPDTVLSAGTSKFACALIFIKGYCWQKFVNEFVSMNRRRPGSAGTGFCSGKTPQATDLETFN